MEKKKFSTVVYEFYNSKKVVFAIGSILLYVFCCIFTSYYSIDTSNELEWKYFYYFIVALQNVFITLFSVVILDFFINSQYKEQLDEDVTKILADPELTKSFIKEEKNQQILECSMDAILGERISKKIQRTILHNYQITDKNSFRENVYVNIELQPYASNTNFFQSIFTIHFDIIGIDESADFTIYCLNSNEEYKNYVNNLTGRERILAFPFLAAKDSDKENDYFLVNYFQVDNKSIQIHPDGTKYTFSIDFSNKSRVRVEFQFQALLNKTENYLFEDIGCVCDHYHIVFNYSKTDIQECSWYSSYEETPMSSTEQDKIKHIDIDDVLLPGTFFIFIWNY